MICDRPRDAPANMALDEALLHAVCSGAAPPTIRTYRWSHTAISVGRFQNLTATLNVPFILEHGIPVVRRCTGGRGVLHGGDVTISVAMPLRLLGADAGSVLRSHRRIMSGIAAGLASLGRHAVAGHEPFRPQARAGDCFATASGADLVDPHAGKLVGAAQRRTGDALLQQISVLWRGADVQHADVFLGTTTEPSYVLADVPMSRLQRALLEGLCGELRATYQHGTFSPAERLTARRLRDAVSVDLAVLM